MRRSGLVIILTTLMMVFLQIRITSAAQGNPIRLITLPIIITSQVRVSDDTLAQMEVKIARSLHVPLNGTLKRVEYISTKESTAALQEIWSQLYRTNRNVHLKEAMRPLAKKLKADVVVCTVLYRCNQTYMTSTNFSHDAHLLSNAGVEMIIFDNRTGEITDKKSARTYRDEYSPYGTADYLAQDCLNKLIDELQLRHRVLNL